MIAIIVGSFATVSEGMGKKTGIIKAKEDSRSSRATTLLKRLGYLEEIWITEETCCTQTPVKNLQFQLVGKSYKDAKYTYISGYYWYVTLTEIIKLESK